MVYLPPLRGLVFPLAVVGKNERTYPLIYNDTVRVPVSHAFVNLIATAMAQTTSKVTVSPTLA